MNNVYVSLGSNRGDRAANLNRTEKLLAEKAGKIIAASRVYETLPWKMTDKTNFFNEALLLETPLTAAEMMRVIIEIELAEGRLRSGKKYEPRIIDIDILFFNNEIINGEELTIPHPLLQERRFVLEPMAEIASAYIHPVLKKSMQELLRECPDKNGIIKRYDNNA